MVNESSSYPLWLQPGDTIGLISPAGITREQKQINAGINILQNAGFHIKHSQTPPSHSGYLAAEDSVRAKEFHDMWNDNSTQALMATRGGYGCLRLINLINLSKLQNKPKLLIGFSDITTLLNGIWQKTGISSIHGPVVNSLIKNDDLSLQFFFKAITGKLNRYNLADKIKIIRPGNSYGVMQGGNLATIVHLLGTPWDIKTQGKILFLEDTGEPMYKIDRMLTQLSLNEKLKNLAGLILGSFDSGRLDREHNKIYQKQLRGRILELIQGTDYPVWENFPAGHQKENYSLPIGLKTQMDSATKTLQFDQC